jgi:hypothetical protein
MKDIGVAAVVETIQAFEAGQLKSQQGRVARGIKVPINVARAWLSA